MGNVARARLAILTTVTIGLAVATALVPRIPQDPAYHLFADQRTLFGIPRALDVLSNIPFFFVGLWGLVIAFRRSVAERWGYLTLFTGVLLTCFGSAHYHWEPNNQTLVWDRLPMAVGFMGLLSVTVSERISHGLGIRLLAPLTLIGLASVIYWSRTEAAGVGDLRPYFFVQFGSLLLLILMLALFSSRYTETKYVVYALAFYALAKILELLDAPIYGFLRFVSGHTLKHLAAAGAIIWLVRMLEVRTELATDGRAAAVGKVS